MPQTWTINSRLVSNRHGGRARNILLILQYGGGVGNTYFFKRD